MPGGVRTPFLPSGSPKVNLRKPFRMRTYERTPRFARFWPKLSVRKFLRICSCEISVRKSFRMRSYKKLGGSTPAAAQNAGHGAHGKGHEPACFFLFFRL